jgi:homoserine acetyltransferase
MSETKDAALAKRLGGAFLEVAWGSGRMGRAGMMLLPASSIARLVSDNEKLRDALRQILEAGESESAGAYTESVRIARGALEGKP